MSRKKTFQQFIREQQQKGNNLNWALYEYAEENGLFVYIVKEDDIGQASRKPLLEALACNENLEHLLELFGASLEPSIQELLRDYEAYNKDKRDVTLVADGERYTLTPKLLGLSKPLSMWIDFRELNKPLVSEKA